MREYPLIVSDVDIYRLRGLLGSEQLRTELERAIVMPVGEIPRGVVTMGSRVQVRDLGNGSVQGYQLVYPRDADPAAHRISVLAPLGTALLGYSEGDTVDWQMPGGTRCFRIERVMQAPRAARESVDAAATRVARANEARWA